MVAGALAVGTVVRLIGLRGAAKDLVRKRVASLCSWWVVAIAISLASVGGLSVATPLFAVVSCLAFREMAHLTRPEPLRNALRIAGYLLIIGCYLSLVLTTDVVVLLGLPLLATIVAACIMAVKYDLGSFNNQTSSFGLAVIWTTALPAMAVVVLIPSEHSLPGEQFFLLMILTEVNDIFAALVGRRLGKRKLAPVISPNKSFEGFLGGVIVTTIVALAFGSWLTELPMLALVQVGLVISLAGTLGDLNMSAIKRCAKVKDSSDVVPGQGGILDRIDSLTLSAPAFYLLLQVGGAQ